MAGLDYDTVTGELLISGYTMHGPGWCLTDLTALWTEAQVVGEDRPIPDGDAVPYRRKITITEHSLDLVIGGDTDQTGVEYASPWVGLEENIAWLQANITDPPATTAGTRAAQLIMPSGEIRTADIHVLPIRLGPPLAADPNDGAIFAATLQIIIPDGRFTV